VLAAGSEIIIENSFLSYSGVPVAIPTTKTTRLNPRSVTSTGASVQLSTATTAVETTGFGVTTGKSHISVPVFYTVLLSLFEKMC
jgi:hypothetical protein